MLEDKTIVAIIGILALTVLATVALVWGGIDGTLLASITGTIGVIVGYFFGMKVTEAKYASAQTNQVVMHDEV